MNTKINKKHTITRHCPKNKLFKDGDNKGCPSPDAFTLREERCENSLSMNWLEYYKKAVEKENLESIHNEISQKRRIKCGDIYTIFSVGMMHKIFEEDGICISVEHTNKTSSHVDVYLDCNNSHLFATMLSRIACQNKSNHYHCSDFITTTK